MSSVPAKCSGWLATTPTGRPSTRPKPTTMFGAYSAWISRNSSVVDDALDDAVHVVGLVGHVRHDVSSASSSSVIDSSNLHGKDGGSSRLFSVGTRGAH